MSAVIRRILTFSTVVLLGASLLGPPAQAAPAKKTSVTMKAPATTASGKKIAISATVKGGVKGQQIVLQVKAGGEWVKVKQKKLKTGGTSQVAFKIPATAAGAPHYRVLAKKKGKAKKATSKELPVTVTSPLTLAVNTSTKNEVTAVTFNGTLKGRVAKGSKVTVQVNHGSNPFTGTWKDLKTVSLGGRGSFSGSVNVPVQRGVKANGAPQINFRAVVSHKTGDIYSNLKGYLIRSEYQHGMVLTYRKSLDEAPKDWSMLVVLYHERWFRMYFDAYAVIGTTDGWDLVESDGNRIKGTYMKPGRWCIPGAAKFGVYCVGSTENPWILYRGQTKDHLQIVSWSELIPT